MSELRHRVARRRRAMNRAADLIQRLRESLYAPPEWALFDQVRSSVGATAPYDVLSTADALAVQTWGAPDGWRIHGFEVKLTRRDLLRELARPEKSGPLKLFCRAWWLVVEAPWKNILLNLDELPAAWGLLEVGTGEPRVVAQAFERDEAEEPTAGFLKALLRAASVQGGREERVPEYPVARKLAGGSVVLSCGHVLTKPPLAKARARGVPCVGCAGDLPAEIDLVLARIGDASEDELPVIEAALEARRAAAGSSSAGARSLP